MRIAIWHNLPSGGGKRALSDQVRGLVSRGHVIEIWCPPTADRSFLPLDELAPEHVVPLDQPVPPRHRIGRWLESHTRVVQQLAAMDRHCRTCGEQIESGGFDLLLAHPTMGFHATPIAQHVALPSLLYLQEPYRRLYEALPRLPWLALEPPDGRPSPRYIKAYLRNLIHVQGLRVQAREELAWASAFDTILVNSYYSRESVLRAYGLDAKVCYLGIDTNVFHPTGAIKEPYVVGLGSLYIGKGIEFAIEALAALPNAGRRCLVWIGNSANPDYVRQMRELAEKRGVRFEHQVRIPHEQLLDQLSRAAVMLYTSRLEPFGYAPLEANACGTAVVAIAEGGVRETIRDGINGALVDHRDPVRLAQALRPFLDDLDHAEEIGRRAREHVEREWSYDASIDRLEQRLEEIRQSRSPRTTPDPVSPVEIVAGNTSK